MHNFALFRLENELKDITPLQDSSFTVLPCDTFVCKILLNLSPKEGVYKDQHFTFVLLIPFGYPFEPPKVNCKSKIYHPNVDEEGRVCLAILREGWTCGYGVENVFVNLWEILMNPSGEDALNVEVGDLMKGDYLEYVRRASGSKG